MTDHAARGADAREDWFGVYPKVAKLLADWHHAPLSWLAFTPNCSWTIGAIAHGLDWRSGDEVLLPANEFPANVYPWMTAATRFGLSVRKVPVDECGRVSSEALLAAIGPKTRLMAASHVSFATGYRVDIQQLCQGARQRGVLTLIDAAQSVGWCDINVPEVGADVLIGAGRKFFCALDGLAWMFVRPEILNCITLVAPGPFSVVNDREYLKHEAVWKPDAWRFTGGAVPTADIFALGASLRLFNDVGGGPAAIESRSLALATTLRQRLDLMGIRYQGDNGAWRESEQSATLVIREVSPELLARLKAARVSVSARFGGARVSCHGFNNESDVDRLCAALSEAVH